MNNHRHSYFIYVTRENALAIHQALADEKFMVYKGTIPHLDITIDDQIGLYCMRIVSYYPMNNETQIAMTEIANQAG